MKNLLFGVSYLGTNYSGWQKQENSLAVQEVIENAMSQICNQNVEIFASGRTDAGVHAKCQCFSCNLDFDKIENLPRAINSKLPEDIRILWVKEVPKDFHARFSAHRKTYQYRLKVADICSPFDYQTTTYINTDLNLENMQKAAKFLVGEHNFEAFCSVKTTTPDYIRTIYSLEVNKDDNLFTFEICGNGFLYNMVRIIVGTLILVGEGKINPEKILDILESKDRKNAGKTMPAKGLILKSVEY